MKRAVDTSVSVGVYEEAKHSRVFLGQRVSWYYTSESSGDLTPDQTLLRLSRGGAQESLFNKFPRVF